MAKTDKARNNDMSAGLFKKSSLLAAEDKSSGGGLEAYVNSKLLTGIEMFRQTRETVSDFCFDQCGGDLMAFAMQARGMREIPIVNTLLYRNRTQTGFEFIDEELYSWSDMLHRYDQIAVVHQKLKPKTDPIRSAVSGLYYRPSSFGMHLFEKRRRQFLIDEELNPPMFFGDDQSSLYSMVSL